MDWIWSSRCLALSCTSTQSSNIQWPSGGGINSPRHQTSLWLKGAESSTVGWSDAILFRGVGSSSATIHCLHRTWPFTQLLRRYAPTHCRIIRCWRPRDQNLSGSFHAAVGWTATDSSVHPVLKASSWRVSVLFKHDHRIDRWFTPMDRRFIRRCCLHRSSSPIHPTQLGNRLSVHPTVSS
jgi:hypothetical protein